jgi:tRNA pseudouridine13 synthase
MDDSRKNNLLPFLTNDFAGLGGVIKMRDEDFFVEEIPLYPASGEGTHIYVLIEKRGIPTMAALSQIAKLLHIRRQDIGFAGQKDAHAVARQWISIEHIAPEQITSLKINGVKILRFERHSNKIKLGHLAGNRFVIRLRQIKVPLRQAAQWAAQIMDILARRGVPNYFGPQRFGNRNDSQLLGRAVVKGNLEEFVDMFLGRPEQGESAAVMAARRWYEQGNYKKAHDAWPYVFNDHRRALRALISSGGNKKKAYNVVDKRLKGFLISAYQSDIFNQVLAARMPLIDKMLTGDMAYKHNNEACFHVTDAQAEQPRCDAFEISPTGPIFGFRMTELTGPAGEIENPLLEQNKLQTRDLRQMAYYNAKGQRRPLRFQPRDINVQQGTDDLGQYLELAFELDSGCYATTLLREITKTDIS